MEGPWEMHVALPASSFQQRRCAAYGLAHGRAWAGVAASPLTPDVSPAHTSLSAPLANPIPGPGPCAGTSGESDRTYNACYRRSRFRNQSSFDIYLHTFGRRTFWSTWGSSHFIVKARSNSSDIWSRRAEVTTTALSRS